MDFTISFPDLLAYSNYVEGRWHLSHVISYYEGDKDAEITSLRKMPR